MPAVLTVGTTPLQALQDNSSRRAWVVIMPSSGLVAANTGTVFVGLGWIPTGVVSAPDQGFAIQQGNQVGDQQLFLEDVTVFKGSIWLVASIAGQIVWVDDSVGAGGVRAT